MAEPNVNIPEPANPQNRQTTVVGNMSYDWIPGQGWISTGPTSALGRSISSLFASTGRGQDIASELGRDPVWQEFFGVPTTTTLPPAPSPVTSGSTDRGRAADAARYAGMAGTSATTAATPIDLSAIFANMGGGGSGGYAPQFVDTRFAESILPLTETPEERAALQAILDDLQARAEAGTTAVRTGWEQVRAVNSAAADKARQMAQEAGPEAARLWIDAANQALTLSSQAAQGLAQFGGMQSVNISPTGGVMNIAALMAAQAPRAQQLAERMGMISAEDIASQARTASMMGEAYAGEIQRTSLIQANNARMAHNERVMSRIASNQQAIAQMRFGASQTNAQIANSAAQFAAQQAAAGSANPRQRIREFVEDVETFGTVKGGAALLAQLYGLTPEAAQQIIDGTKSGIIDWARQQGLLEAQIAAARKAAGG